MVGAIIAAVVALAIAAFDWFVMLPVISASLTRMANEMRGQEQVRVRRGIAIIRFVFAAQFLVFPVVGWFVGNSLF